MSAVSWVRFVSLWSLLATAPAAAADNHVRAASDHFMDVKIAIVEGHARIPGACEHAHPMKVRRVLRKWRTSGEV